MNITQTQFDSFCAGVSRMSPSGKARVRKELEKLGVTVAPTPMEQAITRANQLIHAGRQAELRAVLKLLGVERVTNMGTPQAERFVEFFADDLSFD